jgi:hypothetical protein
MLVFQAPMVALCRAGMWWHPAATDAAAGLLPGVLADALGGSAAVAAAAAAAAAADAEEGVLPAAGGGGGPAGGAVGAGQLLQLAAGMRMTTDVRRAVFVAIMGSEDCAEACEKLLRLPLKVRRNNTMNKGCSNTACWGHSLVCYASTHCVDSAAAMQCLMCQLCAALVDVCCADCVV